MRMIKRDTIQRVIITPESDGQGGSASNKEYKEILTVAVSIVSTAGSSISSPGSNTEFGTRQQNTISVVSNVKLDEYIYARYEFSNRLYKLMRQIKRGNEYYSILMEVND